jgi:rhodanese-related sulfurtransferase
MRLRRLTPLVVIPVSLSLTLALASCGSEEPTASATDSSAAASATSTAIVIDVRTPAEYEMGHLSGALNLDLEGGQLEAALGDLDPSASYIVYCRSGNRSAVATTLMRAQGITSIDDLGPLENAAATTGLDIVTGSEP